MLDNLKICKNLENCLENLKYEENNNIAVAVTRQRLKNSPLIRDKEINCLLSNACIHKYSIAMALTEHRHDILEMSSCIFEAGLIQKWRETRNYNVRRNAIQRKRRDKLSIHYTGSAYMSLVIGLILGTLTFMAELISFRKTHKDDCHRFWQFLSNVVDGRRFYFISRK